MSTLIDEIFEHNKLFVESKEYEQYDTSKYPDKKLAIISCMDTRLTGLIPAAMNFKNGDVKIIKNAGANITHPFGSVMRSILIAVYELMVEEIAVIGHLDCGMQGLKPKEMIDKMLKRGVRQSDIDMINYCGINIESWLHGFDNAEQTVLNTMGIIANHPLMPCDIPIHGFLINPRTGELKKVTNVKSFAACQEE